MTNTSMYKGISFKTSLFFYFFLCFSINSVAYLTTSESGDIVPEGQFRVAVEPQLNYFGVTAHLDSGVREDSQVRLSVGAGQGGYHFDFNYKHIPYPDYDKQPAIGYKVGASFAKMDGKSVITPRFYPIISKSMMVESNRWTPYLSLPIGVSVSQSKTTLPTHFVVGCELTPSSLDNIQFGGEMGFNVRDTFSYVSGYISFFFEPTESITDARF